MREEQDLKRRRFLTATTSVVGGAGVAAACYPYFSAWQPSAGARAAGAPVRVDLSPLKPGQLLTVAWRGKPVWLLRRSEAELKTLSEVTNSLTDPLSRESEQPAFANNEHRSLRPDVLVMIALCTHLGCVPLYRPERGLAGFEADWLGGFFCPCHGSKFDLAGRVFKGAPAVSNLSVPPYRFEGEQVIVGELDAA